MSHREAFFAKLSDYLDGYLSPAERDDFEVYLSENEMARTELELMKSISISLQKMPDVPLPEGFSAILHQKLLQEQQKRSTVSAVNGPKKFFQKRWFKGIAACATIFVFVVAAGFIGSLTPGFKSVEWSASENTGDLETPAVTSAGDIGDSDLMLSESMPQEAALDAETKGIGGSLVSGSGTDQSKVIRSANIFLEVTQLDKVYDQVIKIAEDNQGYLVSSSTYNDDTGNVVGGEILIRVEASKLDGVLEELTGLGSLKNREIYGEDVTLQYVDLEARLKQYQQQKERLLKLYQENSDISDLIQIEGEMLRVQTELDSLTAQFKYLQEVTDFATVNIHLEVPAMYGQSLSSVHWDNLGTKLVSGLIAGINAFLGGVAFFLVGFFYLLPLIIIVVIALLIYYFIKRRNRK